MKIRDEQLRAVLASLAELDDEDLWLSTVYAVGCCGGLAAGRKNFAVEKACVDFIAAMHEAVGTPGPPKPVKPTEETNGQES